MGPLIIFMAIAIVLTYVLIRFSMPKHCRLQAAAEGFASQSDAYPETTRSVGEGFAEGFADMRINACPAGTNQYFAKNDESRCCDGQVVGRSCVGASVCRLSPSADPKAPPYCSDYMAAASFNVKNSQIQNPDTGLCLARDTTGKTIGNLVVGVKCDGSQLWTKNALGQIVDNKTGMCLARGDQGIGYIYTLQKCSPTPEQTFTYDMKTNVLRSAAKGATPMYLQDFSSNPRVNLLMDKMTADEYKNFLKAKNYKISDSTMKQYYKVYHSDVGKAGRGTFLSVQPGDNEFISSIDAMFRRGGK
jgi:hypothetical protein